MPDRVCWFVKISSLEHPQVFGIGEVGPLFGLSLESQHQVEQELEALPSIFKNVQSPLSDDPLLIEQIVGISSLSSSLRFGVVMALLDLYHGGKKKYFESAFCDGKPLPINGLVWMADATTMLEKAVEKVEQGFSCIKLKVGSLDFDQECNVLQAIRSRYSSRDLTIRLDANGAFTPQDVEEKLKFLSDFQIHSIEQPLKPADQWNHPELGFKSPIPVALDEQLIGRFSSNEKESLMDRLRPSYLVLKPGLVGGFVECREWISIAQKRGVGWWITSALETPLGLNAIAQFTALFDPQLPQGLGTGQVFEELFDHPLVVKQGYLSLKSPQKWGL